MPEWDIRIVQSVEEMPALEELQRLTWPGSETDVIPGHMLLAIIHNGGLAIGAYVIERGKPNDYLVGMVFGFAGFYLTADGPRLKHHSHILAVHPDFRGKGLGFALKRAQWQMVRQQGIDRVTWTYDPLLSHNAHLNISRLGAVCNTYLCSEYGKMRDQLNTGLPSDRFQVDWWVDSNRVERRLSHRAQTLLTLEQINNTNSSICKISQVGEVPSPASCLPHFIHSLLIVEIPEKFQELKQVDPSLARDWRFSTREIFETAFRKGYYVTDFVHQEGRSYYVLTYGEATLQD